MLLLDQTSLLIAIGFSAAALTLTLVITWLGTRPDRYLLTWSIGLFLVAPTAAVYGWVEPYQPLVHFAAFTVFLAGFAFIYIGCVQFTSGRTPWHAVFYAWAASCVVMGGAFALGLTGVGTMSFNLAAAVFFLAGSYHHWQGRRLAPITMVAQSAIFGATAVTFVFCAAVLLFNGQFVLTDRPRNWAEDINTIALIISLAAAGAMTLALHQFRASASLRQLALTDSLTGLLNRRALFSLAGTHPLPPSTAVVMLDLDDFKLVNDRFGHATGDEVLVRFAAIVSHSLQRGDIAARLGGEEFCLLLHRTTPAEALALAEGIRRNLENSPPLSADFGSPTVSAGIAMASRHAISFDDLLRTADELLYQAKQGGRNRVHGPEPRLVA